MKMPLIYTDKRSGRHFYPAPVQAYLAVCEVTIVLNNQLLMRDQFTGMCFQQKRPRHADFSMSNISLS
jgi:hypothetical protein